MKTYLIDDDPICNYLAQYLLSQEGISTEILMFTAANEALACLLQELPFALPDVIFLDLNMPFINGWDFLEALSPYKAQLAGRCRIYIVTSSLDVADSTRAKDYHLVSGFIHKPITPEDIQLVFSQVSKTDDGHHSP